MPPRKLKNHLQAEVSIIGHSPVESVVNRLLLLTCFFLVPYVKQFKLSKICQTKTVIEQLWAKKSTIECLWASKLNNLP